ncbi:hypothetical protein [Escherichia coli]|uniref:hypothetical protein n=1 Tax=Escherichia coli TaxID=562 RepID=UPI002AB49696|nr:hypothetical protein [Escherichia coli]MDY7948392.1 hypothetical protein [Escherichia coli]HAV8409956.1 hypothetical protein [Escherichia coli]
MLSFQEKTHRGMHGQNACILPCLDCGMLMPAELQVTGQDHGVSAISMMAWCAGAESGLNALCSCISY